MSLQDIKDTFYTTLRDRIATINPGRTTVLRGTTRPAILVTENEILNAAAVPDAFTLIWTALDVDPPGLAKQTCQIHYTTAGASGMDRGRALATLDTELRTALRPQSAPLTSYAEIQSGGASTVTQQTTCIFWTDPVSIPAVQKNEQLARTATVEVFGYV